MKVSLFSIYFLAISWLIQPGFATSQQENKTQTQSDDEQVPSWAMREYNHPPTLVYPAALQSIQIQKHEVQAKNEKAYTVDFHVGVTAWSWGYNMRLVITPMAGDRSKVTVGVLRSGGKVFSWGSGKKEVRKILAGIDAEIAASNAKAPTVTAADRNGTSLLIESDPPGADVELDGKFVGNTPTTLHLKPGDYTVVVKKEGFQQWTRKVAALSANELRIAAELKKEQ
jgi:PEGA domain